MLSLDLDDRINPAIIPGDEGDVDDLLKYAENVYGLSLTEEDLNDGIPENYEEVLLATPIIDFKKVMTSLQTSLTKWSIDRYNDGGGTLKSINKILQAELPPDHILITDVDLNDLLDARSCHTPYIINIEKLMADFEEEQAKKKSADTCQTQGDEIKIPNDASDDNEESDFEIEIVDDEEKEEPEVWELKGIKWNDHHSNAPASQKKFLPDSKLTSVEERSVTDTDGEFNLVISNVRSLA